MHLNGELNCTKFFFNLIQLVPQLMPLALQERHRKKNINKVIKHSFFNAI